METEYTSEEIQKFISGTYDCFDLVKELRSKETLTEDEVERLNVNIEHIKFIMSKEWFVVGLTKEQKTELEVI